MDINKAFNILLTFEGSGFAQAVKGDAGGLTKYGISQAAYPSLNIAALTEAEALAIYSSDYWLKAGCDKLPAELQYIHFDTAVNEGVGQAVKILQQAERVTADGIMGRETLNNAGNITPLSYITKRIEVYAQILIKNPGDVIFQDGWFQRTLNVFKMSILNQLV